MAPNSYESLLAGRAVSEQHPHSRVDIPTLRLSGGRSFAGGATQWHGGTSGGCHFQTPGPFSVSGQTPPSRFGSGAATGATPFGL